MLTRSSYDYTEIIFCYKSCGAYVIPNTVKKIEERAFENCKDITDIIIPNSVEYIGIEAFILCTKLKKIQIPESVEKIGNSAFSYCESLIEINVDEHNKNYASKDGVLFNKDFTEIICFPGGVDTEYTIPDGVKTISEGAFYGCKNIKKIFIPYGVTSIKGFNFTSCKSLQSIVIPESVKNIGIIHFWDDNYDIYGKSGSEAEKYAQRNNINFCSL